MFPIKPKFKNTVLFLLACLAAAAFFLFLYYYDNKYTARAPVSQEGIVIPDTVSLDADRPVYLADGWELYPDVLLSPDEIADTDIQPVPTFIGQRLNFSSFHSDGSPYGQATYRLRLRSGNGPALYNVLLQEVYSSCLVYVNGAVAASSGSITPYDPQIRDLSFSVPLNPSAEVVIQVRNDTHYYSGITYPPLLGTPQAVHTQSGFRFLFYGFLCFSSLALALFSISIWFGSRKWKQDRLYLWFGILSTAFSIRVSYPFVRMAGDLPIRTLYALEDAASLLVICCAVKITLILCGLDGRKPFDFFWRISLRMVLVGILIPLFILPFFPAFTPVYGQIIFWYKLLTALLLTGLALYGGLKHLAHATFLLCGIGIYSISLAAHVITLNRFEPARTCWQDEYGTFLLVIFFAIIMSLRMFALMRENIQLTYHLQEEVAEKTKSLSAVLEERRQFLAGAAHDLKTPMTSLKTFIQLIEDGGVGLDQETRGYLQFLHRKADEMQDRLEWIHTFAIQDVSPHNMHELDLSVLLRDFHEMNLPDLETSGVNFLLKLPDAPCRICGDEQRLLQVLQNLVYNALSFTPMDGTITLALKTTGETAVLTVADTGQGITPEDLPRIFDRFFTHRESGGGTGLGLYLVKTIIQEHAGAITVESEPGAGTCFHICLPLVREKTDPIDFKSTGP